MYRDMFCQTDRKKKARVPSGLCLTFCWYKQFTHLTFNITTTTITTTITPQTINSIKNTTTTAATTEEESSEFADVVFVGSVIVTAGCRGDRKEDDKKMEYCFPNCDFEKDRTKAE